jgi:hypothetical protein
MKFIFIIIIVVAACVFVLPAIALDREAFTFTRYDLTATIDPGQQRLGVRGKVILRNDSGVPQQNAVLQISSTLHWAAIQIGGKRAVFTTQTYNSDIDHTGALSEAIVSLPAAVAPKQNFEIELGYEGLIPHDATRLTRIGVPADVAEHSDWDQISASFTAVRGIGYVAWYPIATEAANMSDASSVAKVTGRWKQREADTSMQIGFSYSGSGTPPNLYCSGVASDARATRSGTLYSASSECGLSSLGTSSPTFVIGTYQVLDRLDASVSYLPEHKSEANNYALALDQVAPSVAKWFGEHAHSAETKPLVLEIPDSNASPFQSGNMLLTPLTDDDTSMLLSAVQLLTHVAFPSSRHWISEGLARYSAVRCVEQEKTRDAALNYLQSHRAGLTEAESPNGQNSDHSAEHSLINAADEFYVQTKAMNVWWMLRDLVGETAMAAALHNYKASDDRDAMYMQKVLETQSHRDLTWFFDDWVYRDRGLPDLRIESVFARPIVSGGYIVTVTVENLGGAAAEVPVTLQMVSGEATEKLLVPAKSKASVRITAGNAPMKATVNDGSVPESDLTNNTYTISASELNSSH